MARLTQKQVENAFDNICRASKIPLRKDRPVGRKYRTGSLKMGYAYGKMQIQYVYPQSSAIDDVTGHLTAREMWDALEYMNLRAEYKEFRKRDKRHLESLERRAKKR